MKYVYIRVISILYMFIYEFPQLHCRLDHDSSLPFTESWLAIGLEYVHYDICEGLLNYFNGNKLT